MTTELTRQRRRRRPVLTDAQVLALPRRETSYFYPDVESCRSTAFAYTRPRLRRLRSSPGTRSASSGG
jgi:hypothetical protein